MFQRTFVQTKDNSSRGCRRRERRTQRVGILKLLRMSKTVSQFTRLYKPKKKGSIKTNGMGSRTPTTRMPCLGGELGGIEYFGQSCVKTFKCCATFEKCTLVSQKHSCFALFAGVNTWLTSKVEVDPEKRCVAGCLLTAVFHTVARVALDYFNYQHKPNNR